MSISLRRLLSKPPPLTVPAGPARKLRSAQPSLRRAFAEQTSGQVQADSTSTVSSSQISTSSAQGTSGIYTSHSVVASAYQAPPHLRLESTTELSGYPSSGNTLSTSRKGKEKERIFDRVVSSLPIPLVDGPVRDEDYIRSQYRNEYKESKIPLTKDQLKNPKNPLTNYIILHFDQMPDYLTKRVRIEDKIYYRAVVVVDEDPPVVGEADHWKEKESIRLAALSAVFQLHDRDLLHREKPKPLEALADVRTKITMPDGSEVNYDRSRAFLEYYCRRFLLPLPIVAFAYHPSRTKTDWEAELTVGERRIGRGTGLDKQSAKVKCHFDVVRYIESCDPQLWKDFVEVEAKMKLDSTMRAQKRKDKKKKWLQTLAERTREGEEALRHSPPTLDTIGMRQKTDRSVSEAGVVLSW